MVSNLNDSNSWLYTCLACVTNSSWWNPGISIGACFFHGLVYHFQYNIMVQFFSFSSHCWSYKLFLASLLLPEMLSINQSWLLLTLGTDLPTLNLKFACYLNCTTTVSCSCNFWIVSVCETMHSVFFWSTALASPCIFTFDGSVLFCWILMLNCVIICVHTDVTTCLSNSRHASLRSACTSKVSKAQHINFISVTVPPRVRFRLRQG